MDYKTVFQLAQDKGYKPDTDAYFDLHELSIGKDDIKILLKHTLIQKWLRDEHEIYVMVDYYVDSKVYFGSVTQDYKSKTSTVETYKADTYEQALLEGINESLKLITV